MELRHDKMPHMFDVCAILAMTVCVLDAYTRVFDTDAHMYHTLKGSMCTPAPCRDFADILDK